MNNNPYLTIFISILVGFVILCLGALFDYIMRRTSKDNKSSKKQNEKSLPWRIGYIVGQRNMNYEDAHNLFQENLDDLTQFTLGYAAAIRRRISEEYGETKERKE